MKKTIGIVGLLALGAVVLLVSSPAQAACGAGVSFGQGSLNCGGGYCYVLSPGGNTNASIQATFWDLGFGNPAVGPGSDNGSLSDDAWLVSFGGPLTLLGDWAALGIDGCPDGGTGGGTTAKMVVALSDVGSSNAFHAAVCVTRDPQAATEFDQSKIVPNGNINLVPLPKATIATSTRVGNEANVVINSPNFASMYYSDGSPGCAIGNVIPQYEVYRKQVARDGGAPTDSDVTSGAWTLAGTCNVGASCTVTTACATTNCDTYFAISPKYANGYTSGDAAGRARVGAPSTRVQAGPVLATPPDFKTIKKSSKDVKSPTSK